MSKNHTPHVAIVGRANVGKSRLWNRLTETNRAMISPVPHTTRDRMYAPVIWRGQTIDVVDTGGLDAEQGSEIGRGIRRQAEIAVKEADLILFLIDAKDGALPQDRDFAHVVQRLNPHILLVANKVDRPSATGTAASPEIWKLGLGESIPCSAATSFGIGDLLDRVYEELTRQGKTPQPIEEHIGLRLVVMGRPNVGKSSLVNAILGEERIITSSIPHTTREPIDTHMEWRGQRITIVDTAGMRRRARVERGLEEEALERNRDALSRADIAFLVLDALEQPSDQDKRLAGLLQDETKGLALIVNKWDLVRDKTTNTAQDYTNHLRHVFPFLPWAPILFTSAIERLRTDRLLDLALHIREERRRQISYNALQRFLKTMIARNAPLAEAGTHSPYVHDMTQVGIEPPTFIVTVRGKKAMLHPNWLRYLEKRLREKFGFDGTPIVITARIVELRLSELPEEKRRRVNRRKRPIGRRVGRY